MTIPFFDYPAVFAKRDEELTTELLRVMRSGKYILQEDLERFERNLADYVGTSRALGISNGTDSIFLALKACDVGPGDEVVLPSHTFIATASAVVAAGALPVLVDVRDDHMADPEAMEDAITERTRVLMPVQLNGRTCDMDAITALAGRYNLIVIEDAAQALGSQYKGRKAGSFGLAGSFSFYPAKLLGGFGDGGGLVTDDSSLFERVHRLRDHGRTKDGNVAEWSFNMRLDNVQAALLDFKLKFFPEEIQRRRVIAARYEDRLGQYDNLLLPPPPVADGPHFDVYQNYEIECTERDALREHLSSQGIGTIVQWGGKAVHQFERLGFEVELPVTERVMRNSLLLPMHTALSDSDVDKICDVIDKFFGG